MQPIPEMIENLRNVRYTDITQQRIITVLLSLYDSYIELQDRIRELENNRLDNTLPVVKLKTGAKTKINDASSIDKET